MEYLSSGPAPGYRRRPGRRRNSPGGHGRQHDLLQRCYSGLELRDDRLVLSPQWLGATLGPLGLLVYRRYYELSVNQWPKRHIDRRVRRRVKAHENEPRPLCLVVTVGR